MTFPGLLRAANSLHVGLRRRVLRDISFFRQFFYSLFLLSLFGQSPAMWQEAPIVLLNAHPVGIAAEWQEPPSALEGEATWDSNYVFKPSPTFWMPLASLPTASFPPYDLGRHPQPPHRLIFASCNRQPEGLDQKRDSEGRRVWSYIGRRRPRAFLWMGDNVYADHMQLPTANESRDLLWKVSEGKKPIPPPGLVAAYNSQLANKEYRAFLAEVPGIAGTWDDHDMGEDNANKMYQYKDESKEAMLDFLGVDPSDAIRSLEWGGVYSSHDLRLGEDLLVKVIFLDLRFEKDSWWLMDVGDMLGEQQWRWLQQELQLSKADVNVVVSSLQSFANHRLITETWSHFPWARERLFALLAGSGAKTPIVLSGDTHYAEFAAIHCQRLPEAWCLDEPQARSDFNVWHSRTTGIPTPQQQLRRLEDSDGDDMLLQQRQAEDGNASNACDPSEQCCSPPDVRSALFWWIPRHLPFFLMALFRGATNPEVFTPRQAWRRPRAPAFFGAFPPPPFAPDEQQQKTLLEEDRLSTYLFDLTSSGLGHGVSESMCRLASAMVELVVYLLTEGVPFGSSLNADITGPRLLYTERNFGELEFIENPLQLLLLPHVDSHSPAVGEEQAVLQRLPGGDEVSRVQLLHVREKHRDLRKVHRQQNSRPLQMDRLLTEKSAAEFRSRLGKYKEQRQDLVDQLRAKPVQRPTVVQRLKTLSASFEVYVQKVIGGNHILFERLLQLHSALLLAHACEQEGASNVDDQRTSQNEILFGSCSLLVPWGSQIPQRPPQSLTDRGLRWLWDLVFGLNAHRAARNAYLPMGDAATLRLSAATDQLTRKSAAMRFAVIGVAATKRRRACLFSGPCLLGARSQLRLSQHPSEITQRRLHLHKVFAAASDELLRKACMQLRSPRRQQQREEMQQLFQRGVASQPVDTFAFAELDSELDLVCSLVDIPPRSAQSPEPVAHSVVPEAVATPADGEVRAVEDSWVLVELLETKAWILSRTFDVVTGHLAKEKLLSTFASEQRELQPGIGQWACEGWKGPTERRMYLCHLCILVAVLLTIGAIVITVILVLRVVLKATARTVMHLGRACYTWYQATLHQHRSLPREDHPTKSPQLHLLPTQKAIAAVGAVVAIGAAAAVFLCMKNGDLRFLL